MRQKRGTFFAEHRTSNDHASVITGCHLLTSPDSPLSVATAKSFPAAAGSLEVCSPPSPPCPDSSASTFLRMAALLSPGMPGNRTPEDGPTAHLRTDGFLPKLPREERAMLLFHLPPSEVTFSSSLPPVRIHPSPVPRCIHPAVLY